MGRMSTTTAEQAESWSSEQVGEPPFGDEPLTAELRAERAARARVAAARLAAEGVEGVILGWVDNAGLARVKTVPVRRLEQAAAWGVGAAPPSTSSWWTTRSPPAATSAVRPATCG